jgi:diaminohydroxyphosphoribosylaminopyrimidine deaminase / 5-amino-6-(5-phosphoribosylamino)uracil reductase
MTPTTQDARWLERAVQLGRKGWGGVHPNPLVGCVLVKDGVAVAEGWHQEYGGPHAEVNALVGAGSAARGATAFVSLEPCDHHGQTPPCSEALIAAGVVRVVYGAADPGERSGGGRQRLAAHGLEVVGPCFDEARAQDENPAFFHRETRRGVYVALKLAVSEDGMIAAAPGQRTMITGADTAAEVQRLRAGFDAILVGSETALVDDPQLTVRGDLQPRVPPIRVVFDSNGRLSTDARLFSDDAPVIVVTSPAAPADWVASLRTRGAAVRVVAAGATGGVDISEALSALEAEGVTSILCEGGAGIATSLIRADRVQRFYLFTAPGKLGSTGVPAFRDGAYLARWLSAVQDGAPPEGWRLAESERFGNDTLHIWQRSTGRSAEIGND